MSWDQLLNIVRENERIKEEEEAREIISCPICGDNDLGTNSQGIKLCPWCEWKGS